MTEQEAFQRCQSGDELAYAWVYKTYWPEFSRWIQRQGCPTHLAGDVYAQAMFAFYRNVDTGRLVALWSELKTYLFQIGKNQWRAMQRGETRHSSRLQEFLGDLAPFDNPFETEDETEILRRVGQEVRRLGEPCASLLELSFQQEMPDRDIVAQTHYKNTDSVKVARWKCLEKLRQIFFTVKKPS